MGTILALMGSPRHNGYCWKLLDELRKGAESRGGAVWVFDCNHPHFRGCQGCFSCRTSPGCTVRDMFAPFYREIAKATGVVFASPIYFADISGQAKKALDRLFPMTDGATFTPRHPGKKVATLFSQGHADKDRFQPAFKKLNGFFSVFGWKVEHNILCSGVSAENYRMPHKLLQQAYNAGADLAV